MAKIDVSRQVAEMERVLRSRESTVRSIDALAVLDRWQWDEMLDNASRVRARRLVREFGSIGDPLRGLGPWGAPSVRRPQHVDSSAAPVALGLPRDHVLGVRGEIGSSGLRELRPRTVRPLGDLRPPRRSV